MRGFTVLIGIILAICFQIGLLYMLQRIEQLSFIHLLYEIAYIGVLFGIGMSIAHYFYKHKIYIFILIFIFFYGCGYYNGESVQDILRLHIGLIQRAFILLFCMMFGTIVYGMLFYNKNNEKKVK